MMHNEGFHAMMIKPLSRIVGMSEHDQSLMLPNDEYNQQLVANVHPLNWINP